jgi:hypothetical protein
MEQTPMIRFSWKKGVRLLLGLLVAWGGYHAVRARSGLVTLKVRNAEVRDVIRKIQWQTWERVLVHREVRGRVTLDLQDVPVAEALQLVAREAGCRFHVLCPLYSSGGSLDKFVNAAVGESDPTACAWSNLVQVIHPLGMPMPQGTMMGGYVTLQVTNRPFRAVALAMGRFANILVVPEDGTLAEVTLNLEACPIPLATQRLADAVHRHTKSLFSLLPGMGPGPRADGPPRPPPGLPPQDGRAPAGPPPLGPGPPPDSPVGALPQMPPPPKEMQQQMEQDYQELMSMLPPDQRARLEAERQSQESQRTISAQQSQQAQIQSGSLSESRREGLKQSSVADRVARDRQESSKP